jgi:phage terminase small subunit
MKLTAKQEKFIKEYLVDLNATKAAERAGYSKKTAGVIGDENLKKPYIAEAIRAERDKTSQKLEITRESILLDLEALKNNNKTINPNVSIKALDLQIKMLGFNAPIKNETKFSGEVDINKLFGFDEDDKAE